jgi:hypothetical protein
MRQCETWTRRAYGGPPELGALPQQAANDCPYVVYRTVNWKRSLPSRSYRDK